MIELTREQWECYRHTPQTLIDQINNAFTLILENSKSPEGALKKIFNILTCYIEYGFRDTECEWVAVHTINKFYDGHKDVDRWSVGFI